MIDRGRKEALKIMLRRDSQTFFESLEGVVDFTFFFWDCWGFLGDNKLDPDIFGDFFWDKQETEMFVCNVDVI